ncbi:hypothetical protein GCM10012320_07180 [Sinomonas cellulolyticus]|uniref:DUF3052 domain-containing protein n=1 Tax=Sinomonas cellulolyticus TaxID=2801916 RepID=A0ABS1K3F2_9MICC|nr:MULTISPECIES: hypothetical protein [Sinomonas]MBL0706045.1 hypothetical protein [Sinomonas cellulolyticus]GHG43207.1 hypothetical protein GCM10012320_07180 [Sinomonas sp. KCTC 49339]
MELWQKLQIRPGMTVAVINAPSDAPAVAGPFEVTDDAGAAAAVVLYVADRDELAARGAAAVRAAHEDRLAWVAYPKAKKLGTDLNRDILARDMIALGADPVRQVSIDETWSALRFRPAFR